MLNRKDVTVILGALGISSMFGCVAGIATTPAKAGVYQPQHHNIPATFAGHPEGRIIYLCATQPRQYDTHFEEDHYLQYEPCPTIPID